MLSDNMYQFFLFLKTSHTLKSNKVRVLRRVVFAVEKLLSVAEQCVFFHTYSTLRLVFGTAQEKYPDSKIKSFFAQKVVEADVLKIIDITVFKFLLKFFSIFCVRERDKISS
jgi:hypothetical protein